MKTMKALATLVLTSLTVASSSAFAIEPIRIEVGRSYDGYTNEDLRRRVWQLERAVAQLQDQVFQLASRENTPRPAPTNPWTCSIQSFGRTHIATGYTKSGTLAEVLRKCSDATNSIHCIASDVTCGND